MTSPAESPSKGSPDVAGTVLEAGDGAAARSYSEALLNAAGAEAGPVVEELEAILADVLRGHPEIAAAFGSRAVPTADKDRIILGAFGGRALPLVVNFLRVLNRNGRLGLLGTITDLARASIDRKAGRRPVTVRSAVPLDEAQRSAVESRIAALLGGTPKLTLEIDPSLIAGLVVQVGDDVYDASVRTRLARLRDRLIERKVS